MSATSSPPAATDTAAGRGYLLSGIGLAVLAVAAVFMQFMLLRQLTVPWYLPALTTVGALLILLAAAQRRSVTRIVALVLVGALAGLEWHLLLNVIRLPDYAGPAQTGQPLPAFETALADGSSLTSADLQNDKATVMVFFRGRW